MDNDSKQRRILWVVLAFLVPVCLVMLVRFMSLTDGEASYDAFYHAGIAKLGPSVFLAKEFPWTDSSIWKTMFSDKELLYHAGIWLVFQIQDLLGIPPVPPFTLPVLFYQLLLASAWLFVCLRLKLPPVLICAGSILFATVSPNWIYRLVMLRPHVVSIAFFLTSIGILAGENFRKKTLWITLLSFVYSWTYSNPHFIAIPPLVYACFAWRKDSAKVFLLPLLSLATVFLGLVIHPQFPNSFAIWKVQSWDALISPILELDGASRPTEMLPPRFFWQITVIPLYLMVFFNLFAMIRLIEREGWRVFNPLTYSLAVLSFLFTGGIFMAVRSIEYAAPLSVLLFIVLFDILLKKDMVIPFRRFGWKTPVLVLFAAAAALASFSICKVVADSKKSINRPVCGMAAWMKQNLKPNEAIVNLDWSDFPMLFYSDSTHRYQCGLDPVFAQVQSPERMKLLSEARDINRKPVSPFEIGRAFNCRYAVILNPRIQQASFLAANGWKIKAEINTGDRTEGWIFALDEREARNLPHTRIRPLKKKDSGKY